MTAKTTNQEIFGEASRFAITSETNRITGFVEFVVRDAETMVDGRPGIVARSTSRSSAIAAAIRHAAEQEENRAEFDAVCRSPRPA